MFIDVFAQSKSIEIIIYLLKINNFNVVFNNSIINLCLSLL